MKIHFVFDKTKKASKIKKRFLRIYKNSSPSNSDYFIVAGGDGFMLKTLKRFYKYNKPFFGINCGTYGFLMNNYNSLELKKRLKNSKKISINPFLKWFFRNKICFFSTSNFLCEISNASCIPTIL